MSSKHFLIPVLWLSRNSFLSPLSPESRNQDLSAECDLDENKPERLFIQQEQRINDMEANRGITKVLE